MAVYGNCLFGVLSGITPGQYLFCVNGRLQLLGVKVSYTPGKGKQPLLLKSSCRTEKVSFVRM
jgi:hypothetical protein